MTAARPASRLIDLSHTVREHLVTYPGCRVRSSRRI